MSLKKYIIPIITLLATVTFMYLFTNVVIYLIISLVLALLGMPIVSFLSKFKFGKFKLSDSAAALITLGLFFLIIYLIGITFLPPLIEQITFLSSSNFHDIIHNIFIYYPFLKESLSSFGTEQQIIDSVSEQVNHFLNFKNISSIFNDTISYTGTILGGLFSVLFITFFFLKDRKMVVRGLLLVTPSAYEREIVDIYRTSRKMLSKYFGSLFFDMLIVCITVTSLMWIFGVKNALVIGCLAGVMNVIPYIGSMVTMFFAIILGVSGCIEINQYEQISGTIIKIVLILFCTNLVDGMLIQPAIYSNSVKAHPLEIFLVILMAGAIGGVLGMVVAIPCYTLLRIIAKEFLDHFKFFKKLTENITE
jgi:predicted PurR-regulated permease PerM